MQWAWTRAQVLRFGVYSGLLVRLRRRGIFLDCQLLQNLQIAVAQATPTPCLSVSQSVSLSVSYMHTVIMLRHFLFACQWDVCQPGAKNGWHVEHMGVSSLN